MPCAKRIACNAKAGPGGRAECRAASARLSDRSVPIGCPPPGGSHGYDAFPPSNRWLRAACVMATTLACVMRRSIEIA